jgi:hypothetical protein
MVCPAMGLLDEAIREHLELKRRRGADPAEVAREQREALEPVPDDAASSDLDVSTEEHALEAGTAPGAESLADERASGMSGEANVGGEPLAADAPETPQREDPGNLEETAELDMNEVLEAEHPAGAEGVQHGEGDSLEWEEPRHTRTNEAAELPIAGPRSAEQPSAPSAVMGEASELTGEAPEQERMHFEHGPSKSSGLER